MWTATALPQRARAYTRAAIGKFAGSSSDRRRDRLIGRDEKLEVAGNGLSAAQENAGSKPDYCP
jgi:hypothetical protein